MILITGASGYLGSHITHRLAEDATPVRAMVYNRQRAQSEGRLRDLGVEWVEADVTKPETLVPALQGVDTVIHTVAIAIEKGPRTYESFNFQGTVNLVEASKYAGIKRFIYISQLGASASLPYRFLASKGKAQNYVASSGLEWTAFQPSTIWGPEDEFANSFARLIPLTPLIFPLVGTEKSLFQPVWVEDVVSCVAQALKMPETIGHVVQLGGPETLSLAEIERRTLQALGMKRWLVPFPMPVLHLFVTLMEAFLPNPPVTRSLLDLLAVSNVPTDNAINQFISNPRPFLPKFTSSYMKGFSVKQTLAQFLGK